jgi:hypothetical protein
MENFIISSPPRGHLIGVGRRVNPGENNSHHYNAVGQGGSNLINEGLHGEGDTLIPQERLFRY